MTKHRLPIHGSRWGLRCLILLAASLTAVFAHAAEELFPRPKQLEPAIRFWTRVYTEVDTRGGFIHDSERLDIVYETVRDTTPAQRRRHVRQAVDEYRRILTKLGNGTRSNLSREEKRVLELWPEGTSNAELGRAAHRLRFQLGQADRFRAGLARSGTWRGHIHDVLDANGVPRELAALPHVESSFDPTAYSKVGAAGMWQFTRSTGLRYMRIDHIVDERRDPFMSSEAAARLLHDNHAVLESWPLAITAYNHGLGGMRRAASRHGKDIGAIVENYESRTFGFASRNFYAAFLAAVDVDANPEKYFGQVRYNPPSDTLVTAVPDYMRADTLARSLGIGVDTLRQLNPALTETVWSGDKFVPKGFGLRLPRSAADATALLASVPAGERYAAQQPDVQHRVRSGETLSQIASRYRVSLASLVQMNGLRSSNFIRAGQVLMLPVPGNQVPATLADASDAAATGEYVVRRGDSIDRIARVMNVSQDDLLRANGIRNKNLIYAGQTLRVPTAAALASAAQSAEVAADAAEVEAAVAVLADAAAIEGAVSAAVTADEIEGSLRAGELDSASAAPDLVDRVLDSAQDSAAPVEEEASLESNALASHQAELAADPSDYTVSGGETIQVQALETLGHYADWLEIRTQRLRDLNGLPFGRAVVIGQALKLDFSKVTPAEFERRRISYQRTRQEEFFSRYHIEDVEEHVIRSGESLWVLTQRKYNVPVWLLRQYNPDLDVDRVAPGTVVKFPKLRPIAEDEAQVST
ncbi:MAG: LysM peptidoglycan-binding domain-containing protein [Gammaproteobacteria bacterium]|nr:LysM peptidoglycan-binding domain-containing protein [Gammaproteobacteria bacterium]